MYGLVLKISKRWSGFNGKVYTDSATAQAWAMGTSKPRPVWRPVYREHVREQATHKFKLHMICVNTFTNTPADRISHARAGVI